LEEKGMRGGIAHHSLIIAIALSAAACGGKDKDEKAPVNGTAAGNEAGPTVDDAAAKAAALQQKIKDFNDQNGGCEECQATEARVRVEMNVPAGLRTYTANPSCMNEARDTAEIREVSDDAAALSDGQFAGAVGDLLKTPEVRRAIAKNVGGDVGRILNGGDDRTAYCQAVCAVLPENSTVTGYKLEAAGPDRQYQTCQAGTDCAIGKAKWTAEPIPNTGEHSKTVCGVFANWAHKTPRLARLSVYFTPPDDWAPPHK
jgi:hypothetical protein